MIRPGRVLILGALVAMALWACAGSSGTETGRRASPAEAPPPVEEVVALLEDPTSAREGVMGLLANLGVGVYSAEGEQILAGSETRPEDFWLFEFEVDYLAYMAGKPPEPFAEYHTWLTQLGYTGGEADLQAIYRRVYATYPEAFLPQFFEASGVRFEGETQLTPLHSWLLLLDTFVPPNGQPAARQGGGLLASRLLPQDAACGWVRGGKVSPNWGLARNEEELAMLKNYEEAYYLAHAYMLADSIEVSLDPSADQAHEAHEEPAEPLRVTFKARIDYEPLAEFPVEHVAACSYFKDLTGPEVGPLLSVETWWEVAGPFEEHGKLRLRSGGSPPGPEMTDDAGEAELVFEPRREPAQGYGRLQEEGAAVMVGYDLRPALDRLFPNADPRLFSRIPDRQYTEPVAITLEWHEATWRLTMSMTQGQPGQIGFLDFRWEGSFDVDEQGRIQGGGASTLDGLTRCEITSETGQLYTGPESDILGSGTFELSGQREQTDTGYRFVIDPAPGEASVDFTLVDEECGELWYEVSKAVLESVMVYLPVLTAGEQGGLILEAQDGASLSLPVPEEVLGMGGTLEVLLERADEG